MESVLEAAPRGSDLSLARRISPPRASSAGWPLGAAVLGATSIVVGLLWDISWHATIGRDTFWTPAHLAIYLGGLLAGLSGGWTALSTTFAGWTGSPGAGATRSSRSGTGEAGDSSGAGRTADSPGVGRAIGSSGAGLAGQPGAGEAAGADQRLARLAAVRATAVRFWGFYAPFGAWVSIWGSFTMIASAAFDDWWHNAYGLDVKIVSPPHIVLAAGILAVLAGALLQAAAAQNRACAAPAGEAEGPEPDGGASLSLVYAYAAGLLLVILSTILLEYSEANVQHGALFYLLSCGVYPPLLVAAGTSARLRWPATTAAALYLAVRLLMTWLLPLFPAHPMLAPIYNPMTHMWPLFFPVLLVVPAAGIDLLLARASRPEWSWSPRAARGWRLWCWAALLGLVFFALLLAVQWPLASFLLTPGARNWFFAGDQWTYRSLPGAWRHEFWNAADRFTATTAAWCLALASVGCGLGLLWGRWLRTIRR